MPPTAPLIMVGTHFRGHMRFVLIILASLVLVPAVGAQDSRLEGLNPVTSLVSLASGSRIDVVRSVDTLALHHNGRLLMKVTSLGVSLPEGDLIYPDVTASAHVDVVREPSTGEILYIRGLTRRGARLLIIEKGHVNRDGLHVLVFDNDDVHIRDGQGRLIYSRRIDANGTLHERHVTCGCARVTSPQGVEHVWPLYNREPVE